jgi:hypothetical protein
MLDNVHGRLAIDLLYSEGVIWLQRLVFALARDGNYGEDFVTRVRGLKIADGVYEHGYVACWCSGPRPAGF